jgi:hypothetical protein
MGGRDRRHSGADVCLWQLAVESRPGDDNPYRRRQVGRCCQCQGVRQRAGELRFVALGRDVPADVDQGDC